MSNPSLSEVLSKSHIIDLSHTFSPGIPHASDMPDETSKVIYDFPKDGFRAHKYEIAGQWGTHIDPPIHFIEDGKALDEIEVSKLVLHLCVFNVEEECEVDPDFLLYPEHIEKWEEKHGKVPPKSFVAMRSGWSKFWPSSENMFKKDSSGVAHFPGWSLEAAKFLIEERNASAFGHEVSDTDGGVKISAGDFSCETYILEQGLYQIELLASLEKVPPTGSLIVVGAPKPKGGSGFPARVIAIVPNG